jgi:hypothetical protein
VLRPGQKNCDLTLGGLKQIKYFTLRLARSKAKYPQGLRIAKGKILAAAPCGVYK